ncbi:hypothetical protein MVES1_000921 [Malassezia vespertilionis]|uniref:RRM domain-containing protein n=1 Tax=Malassezia vespertilionis TaxID=2020962 RepID=A0A2N1JE23_9BASI|nr:uncharacterized protein MVES1_000921 [Malassezia vespertilionis]PKI84801.1 hypothetical protein MVES_000867 [Malassezia vespertilionis]WFD05591.1 hypothetical protein MVES1_000921 [Malassezia vespertilionis]
MAPPDAVRRARPIAYVYHLTEHVRAEHLAFIFGAYGHIVDISLQGGPVRRARIEYEDEEEVQRAVTHMDGGQIDHKYATVSSEECLELEAREMEREAWKR